MNIGPGVEGEQIRGTLRATSAGGWGSGAAGVLVFRRVTRTRGRSDASTASRSVKP